VRWCSWGKWEDQLHRDRAQDERMQKELQEGSQDQEYTRDR